MDSFDGSEGDSPVRPRRNSLYDRSSETEDDSDYFRELSPKAPTSLVIDPTHDAYTDTDLTKQSSIMQPYNQSGSYFVKVYVLTFGDV